MQVRDLPTRWVRLSCAWYLVPELRNAGAQAIWPWVLVQLDSGRGVASDAALTPELAAVDLGLPVADCRRMLDALKDGGILTQGEALATAGNGSRRVKGWTSPLWASAAPHLAQPASGANEEATSAEKSNDFSRARRSAPAGDATQEIYTQDPFPSETSPGRRTVNQSEADTLPDFEAMARDLSAAGHRFPAIARELNKRGPNPRSRGGIGAWTADSVQTLLRGGIARILATEIVRWWAEELVPERGLLKPGEAALVEYQSTIELRIADAASDDESAREAALKIRSALRRASADRWRVRRSRYNPRVVCQSWTTIEEALGAEDEPRGGRGGAGRSSTDLNGEWRRTAEGLPDMPDDGGDSF